MKKILLLFVLLPLVCLAEVIEPPRPQHPLQAPHYPQKHRISKHDGVAVLRVYVLKDGTVGKVELKKTTAYDDLDKEAIKAAYKWRFIPGKIDDEPVAMWKEMTVDFILR